MLCWKAAQTYLRSKLWLQRQSLEGDIFWHSIFLSAYKPSQVFCPSLALELQRRNHRCLPSSFTMHPESDHAYMMGTYPRAMNSCSEPPDPAQVTAKAGSRGSVSSKQSMFTSSHSIQCSHTLNGVTGCHTGVSLSTEFQCLSEIPVRR